MHQVAHRAQAGLFFEKGAKMGHRNSGPPGDLVHRHPVEADLGCRNTVFHARAQSGAELVPALQQSGVRRVRLELVREDAAAVIDLVAAYRALLAGTASAKATLKRLKTAGGYGVVKGSLRVLDDKSAGARA